jgi:hypothetical protein
VFVGGVWGGWRAAAGAQEVGGDLGGDETGLLGETGPRGRRLGMKLMADLIRWGAPNSDVR